MIPCAFLATAAGLLAVGHAEPTWPSAIDELEEIMYQVSQFRGRRFADTILPCTNEASGPGRQNAAEWLRVGFHDMSTYDAGVGGLDGSIQYELDTGENLGPGFNTTLQFMSNYFTSRSSIADLIALGVYASVRSCRGPVIPFRAGRRDAAGPGKPGVPQPEHTIESFREQFLRMGFSLAEMIEVTACGHTIGGVHDSEFPELKINGKNGEGPLDSSVADFDNKIVTEYLADNSTNPLVVGPAVELGKDSDARIFASDGNVTAKALAQPKEFHSRCQRVLQKMIDIVPSDVVLSDPVLPYLLKPVQMQLTLNDKDQGNTMRLTGNIRVRTTIIPNDLLANLTLLYKDRNGGNDCGTCSTTATALGAGWGFDDTFAFFPIDTMVSAITGISSFTLSIALTNGTTLFFDNNGNSYPMQDAAILLYPQSCLVQHTGDLEVTAAIRNDRTNDVPVTLLVSYKAPRLGLPTPGLHNMTMSMRKGSCVGHYTLYSAKWTIPGGKSYASRIDIISDGLDVTYADDFNDAAELPGTCQPFNGPPESRCTTVPIAVPTPRPSSTFTAPTTLSTASSIPPSPTTTQARPTSSTPPTHYTESHYLDLSFIAAADDFFGRLVNYIANFFAYDRFQMVNGQLDRVT